MAQEQPFSPEMMQSFSQNAQYLAPAAKAVSMFAPFPGPPGRYFARLIRITGRPDKATGTPIVTFAFVVIARVEDRSQDFAGQPIRLQFYTKGSDKQTPAEAWSRLFTEGYQALGEPTGDWPENEIMSRLVEATARLNRLKYPVVIEVRETQGQKNGVAVTYKNSNIREVLNEDAVKDFAQVNIEITDAQINQDDPLPQIGDEAVSNDEAFKTSFAAAQQYVDNMSVDDLIKELATQNVEVDNPASLSAPQLRNTLLREFVLRSDRNPADFGLDAPFETKLREVAESLTDEEVAFIDRKVAEVKADREAKDRELFEGTGTGEPLGILETDDSELLEEEDDNPGLEFSLEQEATTKAQLLPDRVSVQRAIFKYGPEKFLKSQTDDVLRQILVKRTVANGAILW